MAASQARRFQLLANLERKYRLPSGIMWGVYGAETDFGRNLSTSSAGAQGPFQFMPSTAASMGVDPHNFGSAAKGAARYLANYKDRGVAGMLAAYNAGPAGNPNNPETQAYIPRVTGYARKAPYLGDAPSAPRARRASGGRQLTIPGAPTLRLVERQTFDADGFKRAQRLFTLGQILQNRPESPFDIGPRPSSGARGSSVLLSVLPSTPPDPLEYQDAVQSLEQIAGRPIKVGPVRRQVTTPGATTGRGPTAALQFARNRLGTAEVNGSNRGKLIDQWQQSFGMSGQPWCGIFVGKALQRAGVRGVDARIADTGQLPGMARAGTGGFEKLVSAKQVRPGDVVIWDPGPSGHTGIVEKVLPNGQVVTIEGNTSDQVGRRTHPPANAYYARPRYRR